MKQKKIPSSMKILANLTESEKRASEQSEISAYPTSIHASFQHRPYNPPTDLSNL
jgi:hypothetical protein